MSILGDGFNPDDVPKSTFQALPSGWYVVMITDAEEKPNSAGTGFFAKLTIEVMEGEKTGRKLFENLNLKHPNPETVKMANGSLAAICWATNVKPLKSWDQICNIPVRILVSVEPRKDAMKKPIPGEFQNRIKRFERLDGSANGAVPQQPQQQPAMAGASAVPPWQRKPTQVNQ